MVNPSGLAIGFYALNAHAVDVLRRIASIADAIGVAMVMLDFLNCGDPDRVARGKALYESYGFQPLVSNPLRMFLPVSVVRQLIKAEIRLPIRNLHPTLLHRSNPVQASEHCHQGRRMPRS